MHFIFRGRPATQYETHNLAWIAKIPVGGGFSTPLIVGDKIFVTSEWCSLSCFNKADGKLLWVRSPTYYDVATEEEKKAHPEVFQEVAPLAEKLRQMDESLATDPPSPQDQLKLEKQIHKLMRNASPNDVEVTSSYGSPRPKYALPSLGEPGYAVPTPVSDGQNVYVLFETGVVACYDLAGNRKWAVWTPMASTEHGCVHSPGLVGDRLILGKFQFESVALDTKTGKEVWHNPWVNAPSLWRGSVVTVKAGDETYFIEPGARISRVSDGKCLFTGHKKAWMTQVPTTLVAGNLLFELSSHLDLPCKFYTLPLPPSESSPPVLRKEVFTDRGTEAFGVNNTYYSASPLFHEGLIYCVGDLGVLTVLDAEKGEIVYRKLLDADVYSTFRGGMGSSPTLAGKFIYLFGNQGVTLVIEPGRTYRQLAKNRVESCSPTSRGQESMESCPVFEGKRLYYRGTENLYCIEGTPIRRPSDLGQSAEQSNRPDSSPAWPAWRRYRLSSSSPYAKTKPPLRREHHRTGRGSRSDSSVRVPYHGMADNLSIFQSLRSARYSAWRLYPQALTIILFSLVIDKLGYGKTMAFAWICHVSSAIITMTATGYNGLRHRHLHLQGGRYGALTPIGDAAAMASAIAEAMQRIPDRRTLIDRGMQYTAAGAPNDFSRS